MLMSEKTKKSTDNAVDWPKKLFAENLLLTIFPVLVLLLIVGGGLWGYVLPMLEENNLEQKRLQSKQTVEVVLGQFEQLHQRVLAGELTDSAARAQASKTLGALRYGKTQTGYFWIIGPDKRLLTHEVMPHLVGGDPDTLIGPDGRKLALLLGDMREVANAIPEGGYVRYHWLHEGDTQRVSEKISFVRLFAPWNWVVGTGVYMDDVHSEFQRIRWQFLEVGGGLLALVLLLGGLLASRTYGLQKRSAALFWDARTQEHRFRILLESIPLGAVLLDSAGRVQRANQAMGLLTECDAVTLVGQTLPELGLQAEPFTQDAGRVVRVLRTLQGVERLVIVPEKPVPMSERDATHFLCTFLDVSEEMALSRSNVELKSEIAARSGELAALDSVVQNRQADLERLRKQLAIAGRVFDAASDAVVVTDTRANILSVNPAFTAITGYTAEEVVGRNPRILQSERHSIDYYQAMWRTLLDTHHYAGEIWNRRKNGEAYPCHIDITAVTDEKGEITEFISITQDLSDLQKSRDQLAHLHSHDPLTGLPNRQAFVGALFAACAHANQNSTRLAVAILGIDRFSRVNKTEGYLVGDQLLRAVGERLRAVLPDSLMLGRFAGDEFACAIPFQRKSWEALQQLERLKIALAEPFELGEQAVSVTACVGVAFYPEDTLEPEALTRLASISLDRAKQEHPNTMRLFTDDLNLALGRRISMETELRRGIDRDEFLMFYQPKVHLATGKCSNAESLMRWFRPDGTMVPPNEFIAVAEDIGEIDRLGLIALRQSCQMARALNEGGRPVRLAVNVSPKQLFTAGFTMQVLRMLEVERVDPRWLELEITESTVMEDLNRATRIMGDLVVEGLQFTLDDFGTGYSSLSHIRTLPIGGFKIDRSFVLDLAANRETQSICSLFVKLAKDLHMELTVEGVETEEQMAFLRQFPEVHIQGYYFSKPLHPDAFRKYLGL